MESLVKESAMNPGSKEAVKHGCTCPVLDNAHGRGHLGDGEKYGWWINAECPLHGGLEKEEQCTNTP